MAHAHMNTQFDEKMKTKYRSHTQEFVQKKKKNKRLTKKRKHRKVKETHTHNLCLPPFFRIFVIVHIHNATAAASSSSRHTPLDAVLYDSHNIYTHTRALGVRTIFLFVHSGMVRYDDSNDSVTTTLPENHKRHERQGRAKFGCLNRSSVFVKPYKTPVAFCVRVVCI